MTDRFLMCPPDFFEVAYVINPWMEGNLALCSKETAMQQWQALTRLIGAAAGIEVVTAQAEVPDMVFTANAGLVLGKQFALSHFRHVERQAEESYFAQWFNEHGFEILTMPTDIFFEGAGDALLDRHQPLLWLGYGHRSDRRSASLLANWFDIEVETLHLINPRFYHLDTCFCPLEDGALMYYPAAFDTDSQARIAARIPPGRRIAVDEADALNFACNAVNTGRNIFLNHASDALTGMLEARGFVVWKTELTEFMKAGGSAKCLTLKLNESRARKISQEENEASR